MNIQDYAAQGEKLINQIERRHAKTAESIAALHQLLADGVRDHGKSMGLDDTAVAALVIPKDPR
jgi:hypothetical protein